MKKRVHQSNSEHRMEEHEHLRLKPHILVSVVTMLLGIQVPHVQPGSPRNSDGWGPTARHLEIN